MATYADLIDLERLRTFLSNLEAESSEPTVVYKDTNNGKAFELTTEEQFIAATPNPEYANYKSWYELTFALYPGTKDPGSFYKWYFHTAKFQLPSISYTARVAVPDVDGSIKWVWAKYKAKEEDGSYIYGLWLKLDESFSCPVYLRRALLS